MASEFIPASCSLFDYVCNICRCSWAKCSTSIITSCTATCESRWPSDNLRKSALHFCWSNSAAVGLLHYLSQWLKEVRLHRTAQNSLLVHSNSRWFRVPQTQSNIPYSSLSQWFEIVRWGQTAKLSMWLETTVTKGDACKQGRFEWVRFREVQTHQTSSKGEAGIHGMLEWFWGNSTPANLLKSLWQTGKQACREGSSKFGVDRFRGGSNTPNYVKEGGSRVTGKVQVTTGSSCKVSR